MLLAVIAAATIACISPRAAFPQTIEHVIHISVDGLRPDAVIALGPVHCPNFHMLMVEGAFTLNARTDCDYTNTLPNHTCQLTGRAVHGPDGHSISFNSDTSATIEEIHGSYVAGIFDVVHDNGLVTALFNGKSKFALFDRSWDAVSGAPDITSEDNGRDKIDYFYIQSNTTLLVDSFVTVMTGVNPGYAMLHLRDPDSEGHAYGWKSPEYLDSVMRMDAAIGRVLDAVETDPVLSGRTAMIVTADHGGTGTDHSNASDRFNYTIPFHTWGPGIPAGADIYLLNTGSRFDPASDQLPCDAAAPPVRNGESANLAADLLGLEPVPGSTISPLQDLTVTAPGLIPWVVIQAPSTGAMFGPSETVLISADAGGPSGISTVEFFANWSKIGEDDMPPYEIVWDELPLGIHKISVRAAGTDGYAATDRIQIEVVSTTSAEIADISSRKIPRVYPNPSGASPSIYMHIPAPGPVEIFLFDAAGRLVGKRTGYSPNRGGHILDLDLQNYPSGVYFFRTVSGSDTRRGKFVLVR